MNPIESDIAASLERLEQKLDALLRHCQRLQEENGVLSALVKELSEERAERCQQSVVAKNRVEVMIARLKSMGH